MTSANLSLEDRKARCRGPFLGGMIKWQDETLGVFYCDIWVKNRGNNPMAISWGTVDGFGGLFPKIEIVVISFGPTIIGVISNIQRGF
jgi:hypothetical protein